MSESPQRRYWLIAPGERARLWDAFQSEGIMAIGWDYLGDLTQYETQEEITARMASEEPSKSKPTNNSKACFQFAHEIKAGDIVIAKQGSSAYLGYGIVRGSYRYEEGRPEYRHLRDVDWKKSGHWIDNDGPIVQKTLTDITIYPIYVKKLVRLLGIAEAAQGGGHDSPLNQILYGPPGTGKTYHTIDLAAKIIGFDTGDHEANLREFNKRLGKNIEFVTFHQSFTYEDFVEGIKPETTETKDRGKQVTYEVQDGIFKLMAQRAEKAGLNRETQAAQVEFERAFEALRSEMEASETDEVEIPMKRVSFNITAIGPNSISFRKHSGGTGHILRIDTLRKVYTGVLDYPNNGLGGYYHPLVDYLREKSQTAPQTAAEKAEVPHVLIIDEINRGNVAAIFGELITLIETDKRSGGKHPLRLTLPYSKAEFSVPSNLYLIGTMNTADRSVEALDTALRRRFSFTEVGPQPELLSPKSMIVRLLNVEGYADLYWEEEPYHSHALKLYDFLGVEMDLVEAPLKKKMEELPDAKGIYWGEEDLSHLTANHFKGIQMDSMLEAINSRIHRLIDKDHMIGHAYFMGIATAIDPWQALKEVFHRNLLPLLQEYFFGDHGKIGLVLGNGFVVKEEAKAKFGFAAFDHPAAEDFSDRIVYRLVDVAEMNMDLFREAVQAILPATQTESND
jgi:hypothetical protein